MDNLARRRLLKCLAAGIALPWLGGCAMRGSALPAVAGADLSLFYFADTLDAREPGWPVVPRVRLGSARRIGAAPWITGPDALAASGTRDASIAPLLDAGLAGSRRYGGYAALAGQLEALRRARGAERCLTLENGQCWNGSGLTYLTQGRAGLDGSRLLGSEARVSSDERVLWPESSAALYRQYGHPVLGATLAPDSHPQGGTQAYAVIRRQGLRLGLVGATDPYASDQPATLSVWLERLEKALGAARREADLVVVLADVGTGAGLWLAERLQGADLLLCARGQDLWPTLIPVTRRDGSLLPVCLPGTRGVGLFEIRCRAGEAGWAFSAQLHPVLAEAATDPALLRQHQAALAGERAAHAGWLDQRLARAPVALWRRDLFGGSWDALIGAALGTDSPGLLPGLRYDFPLQPGEWITREHLLALSGGYEARVLDLQTSREALRGLLEDAADQRFGEPLVLDDSQDMPRLLNVQWNCRYGAPRGQRVGELRVAGQADKFSCRTFTPKGGAGDGEPLWQVLERHLRAQPAGWTLAALPQPLVSFVEGHPGWHPLAGAGGSAWPGREPL